jgi:FMN reductase
MPEHSNPLIVGIGGTTLPGSSTERALVIALRGAEAAGCRTLLLGGAVLASLPLYTPHQHERTAPEQEFVAAVRECSGLILASPGYHGSVSGLVKNAIDLIEETARDARPYLTDVPVGILATAYGWQATGTTIVALRSIVHALRGWPTPFAAAVNTVATKFDAEGGCSDPAVEAQLRRVGAQVARGARLLGPGEEKS